MEKPKLSLTDATFIPAFRLLLEKLYGRAVLEKLDDMAVFNLLEDHWDYLKEVADSNGGTLPSWYKTQNKDILELYEDLMIEQIVLKGEQDV